MDLYLILYNDTHSRSLYDSIIDQSASHTLLDTENVRRFACFSVALGTTIYSEHALLPWLTQLHPQTYYPQIQFTPLTPSPRVKVKAKIAYLLLVHSVSFAFASIQKILVALTDTDSVVLIHVDAKTWHLHLQIEFFISTHPEKVIRDRVFMLKQENRVVVQWGMVSIVNAQVHGYFTLLDLAEWEFVINLSTNDYPIRNASFIYSKLKVFYLFYYKLMLFRRIQRMLLTLKIKILQRHACKRIPTYLID